MKRIALLAWLISSTGVCAAAATSWSVPTRVDVVGDSGFMVYGSFGNPIGCSTSNQFFVLKSHTQYNQIYATVMSAIATGRNIQAYVDGCSAVDFYGGTSVTFDTVETYDTVSMQ